MSLNAQRLIASEMGLGSMVEVKSSLFRPVHCQEGGGENEAPRIQDDQHIKVVSFYNEIKWMH